MPTALLSLIFPFAMYSWSFKKEIPCQNHRLFSGGSEVGLSLLWGVFECAQ